MILFKRRNFVQSFALFFVILILLLSLLPMQAESKTTPASQTPNPISSPPDQAWKLPWRDKGSPFAVVASLGNRVHQDEIPAAVDLMVEAGVQWQREEIFWHKVQFTSGGPFIWTGDGSGLYNYDYAIQAQASRGINVLGLLDYNPAWFKGKNPTLDEWIEDWGHFVYHAVARYGRDLGYIKYWELWNEPNLAQFGYESGLYTVQDFVRILEVGRAAALAADPEAKIVMGGLASVWGDSPSEHDKDYFEYLLGVAEAGGWDLVDILAVHMYRPDSPEGSTGGRYLAMDLRTELDHLDELLARYGPKPVWITEMGWPTSKVWPGVDEDTQAFYLVRSYILAIAHPSIEKLFWYDFRNDTDPAAAYEYPWYNDLNEQFHYGLLRRIYPLDPNHGDLRKPSFVAFRTMTRMLAGLSMTGVIADGNELAMPSLFWYRFANGERNVDIVWRTQPTTSTLTIDCGCKEAVIRGWNGQLKHIVYAADGVVQVRLDEIGAPMYVEYDPPIAHDGEYFAATGHSIRGGFRDFWYAHGGVSRFGYPLTEEIIESEYGSGRPHIVQYFERSQFELFPELAGTPYHIQVSNLGFSSLLQKGVDWYALPKASNVPTGTLYFEETGHSIQPPFQGMWQHFGGIPLLGYPLSESFERFDEARQRPYRVQYFERARLEYFPEYAGKPAEMQFGLLGRELFTSWGNMP